MLSYRPATNIQWNFGATSATSAPTGAFTQLSAASGMPQNQSGKLQYFNSSGQILSIAYGAPGVEQVWLTMAPTNVPVQLDVLFPGNQRLSVKPLSGSATSGWLTIDFMI